MIYGTDLGKLPGFHLGENGQNFKGVLPENIHIPPKDGHWKFRGGGGGGGSKAKIFKGKYEAKLEIPGGWEGPNQKTILGGGIFWNHTRQSALAAHCSASPVLGNCILPLLFSFVFGGGTHSKQLKTPLKYKI